MSSSTALPRVAVIIPFVDWHPLVAECVAGCLRLDYPDFRVCLLPSAPLALPAALAQDPRIEVVPTGGHGIAFKRNRGIAANPQAEVFAFIDSDAVPDADWLRHGVAELGRRSDVWLVGGPDFSPDYADRPRRAVAAALTSVLVSGPRVRTKRGAPAALVDDLKSCNLFAWARGLEAVGGFDESFAVGEDSALCQAVRRQGGRLLFSDAVRVRHHARRLGWPFIAQRITAGYGVPALVARYFRSMGAWAVLFRLLPAVAVLGLAFGWLAGALHPALGALWGGAVAAYGLLVAAEAVRLARQVQEVPAIALALLIGNLMPGVGLLMRLCGVPLRIAAFYRNDR